MSAQVDKTPPEAKVRSSPHQPRRRRSRPWQPQTPMSGQAALAAAANVTPPSPHDTPQPGPNSRTGCGSHRRSTPVTPIAGLLQPHPCGHRDSVCRRLRVPTVHSHGSRRRFPLRADQGRHRRCRVQAAALRSPVSPLACPAEPRPRESKFGRRGCGSTCGLMVSSRSRHGRVLALLSQNELLGKHTRLQLSLGSLPGTTSPKTIQPEQPGKRDKRKECLTSDSLTHYLDNLLFTNLICFSG